jgi:hypothetical protein
LGRQWSLARDPELPPGSLGDSSTGGDTSSCTGCAPDLFSQPKTLALPNVVATSQQTTNNSAGQDISVTLKVSLTASLKLVPPCSLDWSDLDELGTQNGVVRFDSSGTEMVSHVFADLTDPGTGGCITETSYTLDAFVSLSNLADYGVRNYHEGTVTMECPGARAP